MTEDAGRPRRGWPRVAGLFAVVLATSVFVHPSVVIGVPLTGFEEWLDSRRRLGAVRLVRSERLLRLTRRRADIEVVYLGSINRLAQAFAQNNLVLSRTARPTGGPPQPAGAGRAAAQWQLRLGGAESFEPAAQTDQ